MTDGAEQCWSRRLVQRFVKGRGGRDSAIDFDVFSSFVSGF